MQCKKCGSFITVVKIENGYETERCKDCGVIKHKKNLKEKPISQKYTALNLKPDPTGWLSANVGRND